MLAVRQRDDLENERELVEKAQQSREAFGLLYEKYYDGIYRFALHRTANVQTALDITSTVFIKALDGIGKFRWRDIPFSAWLYRIATNEINGYFRSKKHHTVSIDENPHVLEIEDPVNEIMEAEDEMQRHEDFLRLHGRIAELPVQYQDVITLKYFEKKSLKEISDILGTKEGTVKSLLHRGLEKLRLLLS